MKNIYMRDIIFSKYLPTEPVSENKLCELLKRKIISKNKGCYKIETNFDAVK